MPEESTSEKQSKTGSSRSSSKTKAAKAAKAPTVSQPAEKKSVLLATGLEDYAHWKALFRNHKPTNNKSFRRGRIWA